MHVDALSAEKRAVDPADSLDKEESVFVDVRNHEAELVDVAGKDDVRFFVRLAQPREGVAISIRAEFVAVRLDVVRPDALAAGFESGGRRRGDEVFEELERSLFHGRTMLTADRRGKTSTAENPSGTMRPPR